MTMKVYIMRDATRWRIVDIQFRDQAPYQSSWKEALDVARAAGFRVIGTLR